MGRAATGRYHPPVATESSKRDERTFTPDEVGEIIDVATRLQHLADGPVAGEQVTMDELAAIARELGISEVALAKAIGVGEQQARAARRSRLERSLFFRHFGIYAIVIPGIALIDLVSGSGFDFFYYPAIGWGMGLGIHALSAFRRR